MDWCDLYFHTVTPAVGHKVRSKLRESFNVSRVIPLDDNTGEELKGTDLSRSHTKFKARVQDPARMSVLTDLASKMKREYGLASPPGVMAVEIALDVYVEGAEQEDLAKVVRYLFWTASGLVSENRRLYRDWKGSGKAIPQKRESFLRDLAKGYTLGVGSKTDPMYQRMYVKTTDNKESLPQDQWRARTEVALSGDALPCKSLDQLARFNFVSLRKHRGIRFFSFHTVKDYLTPFDEQIMCRMTQIGERQPRPRARPDGAGHSGQRLYGKNTQADWQLNGKAGDALKALSRRWQRG